MLEYIKRMRSRISHDPLLLCGASIILYNASKQVLMLQRSGNGCWCFPIEISPPVAPVVAESQPHNQCLTANLTKKYIVGNRCCLRRV